MFIKTFLIATILAISAGLPQGGYDGHGHDGHAFSSQSIVLHGAGGHGHEAHYAPALLETHHQYQQAYQSGQDGQYGEHHVDYYAHPKYEYEYKIEDPHTGDHKFQHEIRDGDVVKGVYSLHEPDGTIRTVKYSADKHSGFNAEVHREGHATHIEPEHHHDHY